MDWDSVKSGLLDELEKIAGVDLSGLSPQTLLSQKTPPPMETDGYQKAVQILDRAAMLKSAGVHKPASQTDDPYVKHVRPAFKAALKGTGAAFTLGTLHSLAAHGTPSMSRNKNLVLAGVGALGGLADHSYTSHALKKNPKLKEHTASITSPAFALRASQKVGKLGQDLNKGPGFKQQIRGTLVGRKGALPPVSV